MGKRQRDWAHRKRVILMERLGNRCALCDSPGPYEFDHIFGKAWVTRKRDVSWRISTITAEIDRGLIRLLCGHCNKTNWPRARAIRPKMDEPY